MSMAQTTTEISPSGDPQCPRCGSVLPPHAMFCASCGERVSKKTSAALMQDGVDIATRYRLTSLVRRRPYVNLFFAINNQQQYPVALRDIDISSLNDDARVTAVRLVQHEYNLLRHLHIPSVLPVIDLRNFKNHLYVVAGWPNAGKNGRLFTLQDVLQSGKGLPDEKVALSWIERFCYSLDNLHRHQIVIGDLDPQTIILSGDNYYSEIALMVSWLPLPVRNLLPDSSLIPNTANFSAPEALDGKPESRSDVYSLGALLYLLLTGTPPEKPALRMQHRLRLPSDLNSRLSSNIDEFILRALAIEASERFQSANEMANALADSRSGSAGRSIISAENKGKSHLPPIVEASTAIKENETEKGNAQHLEEIAAIDTVLVPQLPATSLSAWQSSQPLVNQLSTGIVDQPTSVQAPVQPDKSEQPPHLEPGSGLNSTAKSTEIPLSQRLKQRITGILPAIPHSQLLKTAQAPTKIPALPTDKDTGSKSASPTPPPGKSQQNTGIAAKGTSALLQHIQRMVLGEQKHTTTAAAIIETPLRVQPNQSYVIRITVMGRDEATTLPDDKKRGQPGGLSALVEDELVHIEVRSALYQSYAYIVQHTAVYMPARGYAAEVTIPMQPLSSGPSGRRDRLHIFFMDEMRRPLYEKPFVVELFISHLVQPGHEGHNVLTIPM